MLRTACAMIVDRILGNMKHHVTFFVLVNSSTSLLIILMPKSRSVKSSKTFSAPIIIHLYTSSYML